MIKKSISVIEGLIGELEAASGSRVTPATPGAQALELVSKARALLDDLKRLDSGLQVAGPELDLPMIGRLMIWDAQDPENSSGPWHGFDEALEGISGERDLAVGDEVELMLAMEQPRCTVKIISIPEDPDLKIEYEILMRDA